MGPFAMLAYEDGDAKVADGERDDCPNYHLPRESIPEAIYTELSRLSSSQIQDKTSEGVKLPEKLHAKVLLIRSFFDHGNVFSPTCWNARAWPRCNIGNLKRMIIPIDHKRCCKVWQALSQALAAVLDGGQSGLNAD